MSGGGGYDLLAIYEQNRKEAEFYRSQRPRACPNDGTPLASGGPNGTVLYCPHDGWQYPRDYDVETQAGL